MTEKLRDSGVEWLGEIPVNWKLTSIGKIFHNRSEKVSDFDFKPLSVTKNGILPQLDNVAKSDNHSDRKKVCVNDFVINSRSDRKMSSGVSPLEGSVSLINTVLYGNSIVPEYTHYLLKNHGFAEEFYRWGTGIVADLWSTNFERMKRIVIAFPSKEEQIRIANFLDKKLKQINTISEDTEQSIVELKKYKLSLITENVTKGLNANVEMKSSGIEWIGDIPTHWNITKMKHEVYIRARLGWKGLKADEYVNAGYAFLSTPNIKNKNIDFTNVNFITKERYDESPEIKLSEEDVLLTKDGSTLGTVNVVRFLEKESTVNSSIAVLTPSNKINGIYLYYFIKSEYTQNVINQKKDGMGVPHLFQRDIREFVLLLPSTEEQQKIVDFLDEKCSHIDSLIEQKEQLLVELDSYKKSVVYEYVTGKKEVL